MGKMRSKNREWKGGFPLIICCDAVLLSLMSFPRHAIFVYVCVCCRFHFFAFHSPVISIAYVWIDGIKQRRSSQCVRLFLLRTNTLFRKNNLSGLWLWIWIWVRQKKKSIQCNVRAVLVSVQVRCKVYFCYVHKIIYHQFVWISHRIGKIYISM